MSRSSFARLVLKRALRRIITAAQRRVQALGYGSLATLAVVLLTLHATGTWPLAAVAWLDRACYDAELRLAAPPGLDSSVVMVDVDEHSLGKHGRWPWRRALLADVLERIVRDGGARLVGLDIVLTEADNSAGLSALAALDALAHGPLGQTASIREALNTLRPALDDDARLADALRRLPVVLAFHLSDEVDAAQVGKLPAPILPAAALGTQLEALPDRRHHGGILPALQQAARHGAGYLNGEIDDDGVLRRMPLLLRHEGQVYGALSLVMAQQLLGGADTPAALGLSPAEPPLRALRLAGSHGALQVPVNAQAQALLPYRASAAGFLRIAASDVLAGRVAANALRGKAVLVGVSAPGLVDQRNTPIDSALHGTLLHANMLAGMLEGRVIAEASHADRWQAGLLVLVALVMAWAMARRSLVVSLVRSLAFTVGLLAVLLAGHALAWHAAGVTLPLGAALLLPPLLLALHVLLAYRSALGARLRLKRLFGQYVPPELVDEMARQPRRHTMTSRAAELSVLFADVRGFTGLAERMPPAELSAMMNLLFSRLTDTVRAHRGTLDKYIGDCVMAFWGAPLDDPDHARHAVDAALAMRAQLPALQDELAARGWPRLDLSIGVDSGNVVVGDMGSRHRMAYTVLGDVVNRAARLQALAGNENLGLAIGGATQLGQGARPCVPLGTVVLRGRDAPLSVWWPLPEAERETAHGQHWCQGWQHLRAADDAGRREEAQALLAQLEAQRPGDALCAWQRRRWAALA